MSKKSERETLNFVKQASGKDEATIKLSELSREAIIEAFIKSGKVKKAFVEDAVEKVGFNRYVFKGEIESFWKEENIDGEDYFLIIKED